MARNTSEVRLLLNVETAGLSEFQKLAQETQKLAETSVVAKEDLERLAAALRQDAAALELADAFKILSEQSLASATSLNDLRVRQQESTAQLQQSQTVTTEAANAYKVLNDQLKLEREVLQQTNTEIAKAKVQHQEYVLVVKSGATATAEQIAAEKQYQVALATLNVTKEQAKQKIVELNAKIREAKEALSAASSASKTYGKDTDELNAKVEKSSAELANLRAQAAETAGKLSTLGVNTADAAQAQGQASAKIKQTATELANLAQATINATEEERRLEQAFRDLNIKSARQVEAEVLKIQEALALVAGQAGITAQELTAANERAAQKIALLRGEVTQVTEALTAEEIAAAKVAEAFARLKIRSVEQITRDIDAITAAIDHLKTSTDITALDMARALDAAGKQWIRLNEELKIAQQNLNVVDLEAVKLKNSFDNLKVRSADQINADLNRVSESLRVIRVATGGVGLEFERAFTAALTRAETLEAELNNIDNRVKKDTASVSQLDEAFQRLNFRSAVVIREDIDKITAALATLRTQGNLTFQEMTSAEGIAAEKIELLNQELRRTYGLLVQESAEVKQLKADFATLKIRSIAEIQADIERVNAALARMRGDASLTGAELTRAFRAAKTELASLNAELLVVEATSNRWLQDFLFQLRATANAFALIGTVMAGAQFVQSGRNVEDLTRQLTLMTGSAEEAGHRIEFLKEVAERSNLRLAGLEEVYARFTASMMGGQITLQQQKQLFEALATSMGMLGLPAEKVQGAFEAVAQMSSKGVVSLEELRGQLGDRLPGALQISADAMGMTKGELIKMVSTGKLASDIFLPRLAVALDKQNKEWYKNAAGTSTLTIEINKMLTQWDMLAESFSETEGWTVLKELVSDLGEAFEYLRTNGDRVVEVIVELGLLLVGGKLVAGVLGFAGSLAAAGGAAVALEAGILSLRNAVLALNTAMKANIVIAVAIISYELGKWARENFETVQKAGVLLSEGLTLIAEAVRFLGEMMWASINPWLSYAEVMEKHRQKQHEILKSHGEMYDAIGKQTKAKKELGDAEEEEIKRQTELLKQQELWKKEVDKAIESYDLLKEALDTLGVSQTELATGLSDSANKTSQAFQELAVNSLASTDQIGVGFVAAMYDAKGSIEEMDAILTILTGSYEKGLITVGDYKGLYDLLPESYRKTSDEAKKAKEIIVADQKEISDAILNHEKRIEALDKLYEIGSITLDVYTQSVQKQRNEIAELSTKYVGLGVDAVAGAKQVELAFKDFGVTPKAKLKELLDASLESFRILGESGEALKSDIADAYLELVEQIKNAYGEGTWQAERAINQLKKFMSDVEIAFEKLGIQTKAVLQAQAKEGLAAFEVAVRSGKAVPEQLKTVWEELSAKVIEAFGPKVGAQMLNLESRSLNLGRVLKEVGGASTDAMEKFKKATEDAGKAQDDLAAKAKDAGITIVGSIQKETAARLEAMAAYDKSVEDLRARTDKANATTSSHLLPPELQPFEIQVAMGYGPALEIQKRAEAYKERQVAKEKAIAADKVALAEQVAAKQALSEAKMAKVTQEVEDEKFQIYVEAVEKRIAIYSEANDKIRADSIQSILDDEKRAVEHDKAVNARLDLLAKQAAERSKLIEEQQAVADKIATEKAAANLKHIADLKAAQAAKDKADQEEFLAQLEKEKEQRIVFIQQSEEARSKVEAETKARLEALQAFKIAQDESYLQANETFTASMRATAAAVQGDLSLYQDEKLAWIAEQEEANKRSIEAIAQYQVAYDQFVENNKVKLITDSVALINSSLDQLGKKQATAGSPAAGSAFNSYLTNAQVIANLQSKYGSQWSKIGISEADLMEAVKGTTADPSNIKGVIDYGRSGAETQISIWEEMRDQILTVKEGLLDTGNQAKLTGNDLAQLKNEAAVLNSTLNNSGAELSSLIAAMDALRSTIGVS